MSWVRRQKIASQLKQELSDIINYRVSDPRVGKVTITEVNVRPDMKTAMVKYCKFMEGALEEPSADLIAESEKAIESAQAFIFSSLRKRLSLRYLPHLFFRYDRSFEGSAKVWHLISQLESETGEKTADRGQK